MAYEVNFPCADCGSNTAIDEYYMLHDKIWYQAVGEDEVRFLCIGCVEKRLGRTLTAEDFTNCPLNMEEIFDKSPRFRNRLGSKVCVRDG